MKKYKGYLICLLIGLAMAIVIMLSKGIFAKNEFVDVMHILTDAFFVPGVLLVCFGLLILASNGGTFDMLSYGVLTLFNLFRKDMSKMKHKTFYDYRTAKHEKDRSFLYIVLVGIFYILISMVFLVIYMEQA